MRVDARAEASPTVIPNREEPARSLPTRLTITMSRSDRYLVMCHPPDRTEVAIAAMHSTLRAAEEDVYWHRAAGDTTAVVLHVEVMA